MKKKFTYKHVVQYLLLAIVLLLTVTPVYIVISNSLRKTLEIKSMPPKIFFEPTWKHFERLFMIDDFYRYFINSVIISVTVTVITIVLGTFTAYGFKLFKSRIGEFVSNFLLLGKLVPPITILIPLYIMLNSARLTGTYLGPILAHSALGLSFTTWLLTSFIRNIPMELLESACVDGSTRMNTLFKIIFPMLTPVLASAVILIMRFSWNELMFSLQLTNIKTYPLTVGIARYVGAISVDWGKSSAAATIAMIPMIIIGFIMQKYLVTGISSGAVKG